MSHSRHLGYAYRQCLTIIPQKPVHCYHFERFHTGYIRKIPIHNSRCNHIHQTQDKSANGLYVLEFGPVHARSRLSNSGRVTQSLPGKQQTLLHPRWPIKIKVTSAPSSPKAHIARATEPAKTMGRYFTPLESLKYFSWGWSPPKTPPTHFMLKINNHAQNRRSSGAHL